MTFVSVAKKSISRRKAIRATALALTGTVLGLEACADPARPSPTPPGPTSPQPSTSTATPDPTAAPATDTPVQPGTPTPAPVPTPTVLPAAPPPEFPVQPYISREQQLVPLFNEPSQSFYLQPWRGFLETIPARQFLDGLGINYNLPGGANDPAVLQLLAESGFRNVRLEISWDMVAWEEDRFLNQARLGAVLAACKTHSLTPLILLNANDGAPCPNRFFSRTLKAAAAKGVQSLQLDSVADLEVGRSGLSTGKWREDGFMAELLFTGIDAATGTVQLSKPLPVDLAGGAALQINTLKYLPLYPATASQFDETARGWLNYVRLVTDLLRQHNIADYELEVWNELTFSSRFVSINNYYDPPLLPGEVFAETLWPGGACWELARRTAEQAKQSEDGSKAKIIWGFSNTSFYHTAVPRLPVGINGQSYHPYGADRKVIPQDFPPKERYDWFIEKYIPQNLAWCMPEGWAHLGVQTETLMRLLNPETRRTNLPPGATTFAHYMTEHGFLPEEAGITDPKTAQDYKAKALVRAALFWLNKGLSKMYFYSAYQGSELESGLLTTQSNQLARFAASPDRLESPALQALKHLKEVFETAGQTTETFEPLQLSVEVTALGDQPKVFEGDATHPPLYYRDMTAILPYQAGPGRFVIAFYTMSYDFTQPFPGLDVRIKLKNLPAGPPKVLLFDPIVNQYVLSQGIEFLADGLAVTVTTKDYPLLLILEYR